MTDLSLPGSSAAWTRKVRLSECGPETASMDRHRPCLVAQRLPIALRMFTPTGRL